MITNLRASAQLCPPFCISFAHAPRRMSDTPNGYCEYLNTCRYSMLGALLHLILVTFHKSPISVTPMAYT